MRAGLESFARRWWAGDLGAAGAVLSTLGAPLSWAWGSASGIAGRRDAARAERVEGVRVVSVGNLAVGGTGKTPLTGWIVSRLIDCGARPAVVVGDAATDEAALHRRRPGPARVPVLVERDRVAAAELARERGASVVVLDDGFQHRRLARDLDVVLLSAEDAFPGPLLPCGPYRESADNLGRADAVLVTRRTATADEADAVAARAASYAPGLVLGVVELGVCGWAALGGGPAQPPLGDVLAACGVARPERFRTAVRGVAAGSVELVAFADHHEYTAADAARLKARARGRPIVITEKDAVKLWSLVGTDDAFRVLMEEVRWDRGEAAFLSRLREAAARP
jgi:tetraacyldisaccharide 4'-kinase